MLTHYTGIYLSLNNDTIPNYGYVLISDVGSSDDTALICHTNHLATTNRDHTNSGGDWVAPNGITVNASVPGFRRSRGPMMVRLLRNTTTDPPSEGIYHCLVEDDTLTEQTVYVGLYNSGGGKNTTHGVKYTCTCTTPVSVQYRFIILTNMLLRISLNKVPSILNHN